MNKHNVDAAPQGEHSVPGRVGRVSGRNSSSSPQRRPKVYSGAELERIDVTVRTLKSFCLDAARLLKSEGWVDVLADLEDKP